MRSCSSLQLALPWTGHRLQLARSEQLRPDSAPNMARIRPQHQPALQNPQQLGFSGTGGAGVKWRAPSRRVMQTGPPRIATHFLKFQVSVAVSRNPPDYGERGGPAVPKRSPPRRTMLAGRICELRARRPFFATIGASDADSRAMFLHSSRWPLIDSKARRMRCVGQSRSS